MLPLCFCSIFVFEQFSPACLFYTVLKLCLISGKVQVTLVWNSRNENSPSSAKLNALGNVKLIILLFFFCFALFVGLMSDNYGCSSYGEMVALETMSI